MLYRIRYRIEYILVSSGVRTSSLRGDDVLLLHDLGAWCFRRAKTVVALWLGLLVLLGLGVVALHSDYDDSFTIPGAPSQLAYDKLQVTFPQASALSANVVITVPDGTDISSTPIRSRIEKGVEELKDLKDVTGATSPWNKHVTGTVSYTHLTLPTTPYV